MGSQRNLGLKYGPAKLSGVVDLMFQSCKLETCGHARFLEAMLNLGPHLTEGFFWWKLPRSHTDIVLGVNWPRDMISCLCI